MEIENKVIPLLSQWLASSLTVKNCTMFFERYDENEQDTNMAWVCEKKKNCWQILRDIGLVSMLTYKHEDTSYL